MKTYKFWVKVNLHASLMWDIFESSSKENKDKLLHAICYLTFLRERTGSGQEIDHV